MSPRPAWRADELHDFDWSWRPVDLVHPRWPTDDVIRTWGAEGRSEQRVMGAIVPR